ncbi:hypothetical protein KY327_01785 [Candidatus Woesearchaeota archaeon]|nr:hypothetical protein [Candidatus Woesearchaeota archaeon]
MVSWDSLRGLFDRSYSGRLLDGFVGRFGVSTGAKPSFVDLAAAQESFDHLCEVFEQDLRLGVDSEAASYCRGRHVEVLKNAVWMLLRSVEDSSSTLAARALLLSEELSLWRDW